MLILGCTKDAFRRFRLETLILGCTKDDFRRFRQAEDMNNTPSYTVIAQHMTDRASRVMAGIWQKERFLSVITLEGFDPRS